MLVIISLFIFSPISKKTIDFHLLTLSGSILPGYFASNFDRAETIFILYFSIFSFTLGKYLLVQYSTHPSKAFVTIHISHCLINLSKRIHYLELQLNFPFLLNFLQVLHLKGYFLQYLNFAYFLKKRR